MPRYRQVRICLQAHVHIVFQKYQISLEFLSAKAPKADYLLNYIRTGNFHSVNSTMFQFKEEEFSFRET